MDRIPNALDLTLGELASLKMIVLNGFTPLRHVHADQIARLLKLELITSALGGLMPTPAGRIVSRG
jgi:hypothetical protein